VRTVATEVNGFLWLLIRQQGSGRPAVRAYRACDQRRPFKGVHVRECTEGGGRRTVPNGTGVLPYRMCAVLYSPPPRPNIECLPLLFCLGAYDAR
jgi:hypothetical protein